MKNKERKASKEFPFKIIISAKVKDVGFHRKLKKKKEIGIYIESDVPRDLIKPYEYHEKTEDYLMRVKHLPYKEAHRIANIKEHERFFPHDKKAWERDLRIARKLFKQGKGGKS